MSSDDPSFDYRARDRAITAMLQDRAPLLLALRDETLPYRQRTNLQLRYVGAEAARLFAAVRALPREASDEEIKIVASSIDARAPSGEVINWWAAEKSSGRGVRPICDLPPIVKAEHYLVQDLVSNALGRMEHLYGVKGYGTIAAIEDFTNALEEGYDWCWQGDIQDCFQTVRPDALIDRLPLPRRIVTNWLDYRRLNLSPEPLHDAGVSAGVLYVARHTRRNRPRGLLQGSPASNSILALLLSSLASVIGLHDCRACLFADNLFVAARSEDVRDAVASEICTHLSAHPAGRFRLHKVRSYSPRQDFQMLGWALTRVGDELILEPTHAAIERMWYKLADAEDADIARATGEIWNTRKIVNSYRGSFRPWHDGHILWEGAIAQAEERAELAAMVRRNLEAA